MNCTSCGARVPPNQRSCPACLADCGFPNVRFAQQPREVAALDIRVKDASVSCEARKCQSIFEEFGIAVAGSRSVMARSIGDLHSWVSRENSLYITYHHQIGSGQRIPDDNKWDQGRDAAESTIHPNYHREINYACLSLDGAGLNAWGSYHVVLRDSLTAHRSSVFEENVFTFCKKHGVIAGDPPPLGYRSGWNERGRLGQAKLHSRLSASTKSTDLPGILIDQGTSTGSAEYVEVHIFGALHRNAIESVTGPKPKNKPDLTLWKSICKTLTGLGAKVQEKV
jgi:hypothetical protein